MQELSQFQSLETQLLITHAQTVSQFEKEIDDDPVHPCCGCERLQQRKCVTKVSFSDNLGSKVWPALKAFIVEHNLASFPGAEEEKERLVHTVFACA